MTRGPPGNTRGTISMVPMRWQGARGRDDEDKDGGTCTCVRGHPLPPSGGRAPSHHAARDDSYRDK